MLPSICPSCCASCISLTPRPSLAIPSSPLTLSNFLPAGTIRIESPFRNRCDHAHAEDGRHSFTPKANEEEALAFLIEHKFVSATCRLTGETPNLLIRVYLIPFDLQNYGGKLRNRDEAKVLAPARKYLTALLPKISQDPAAWNGDLDSVSRASKTLLSLTIVRAFIC